ncbi:MAG: hypothetical protein EBV64_13980, partial [Oxalobacteraceae bacterium]|nr:hypothetical protein [Oxalobacteraceae bacterium]
DAPVITGAIADFGFTELDDASAQDLSSSGTLSFDDIDTTDVIDVSKVLKTAAVWSGGAIDAALRSQLEAGFAISGADVAAPGSVNWTYTVNDAALDFLAKDEKITLTYTVTVTDNSGATHTDDVTVTITGTNDAPVITGAIADFGFTESPNAAAQDLSSSGTLNFDDIDTTDVIDVSKVLKTPAVWSGGTIDAALKSQLEAGFAISGTDVAAPGSVNWTYTVNDAALDFLAKDEKITLTYTVTITDNSGATHTDDVTVTITGTNDATTLVAAKVSGFITEGSLLSDTGSIDFADVDLTDRPTSSKATQWVAYQKSATDMTALTLTQSQQTAIENAFSISPVTGNTNNGTVNWSYSITESSLDFLAAGEVVSTVFRVTVADGKGGSASEDVTVTITGTNDVPVVTNEAPARAGAITEAGDTDTGAVIAGKATALGTLTARDVDESATQAWSIVGTPSTRYGSVEIESTGADKGKWTYTLDNTLAATQALKGGETVTQTYVARVMDDKGAYVDQVITVTIAGANDTPVASDDADRGTNAGGNAAGNLISNDVDPDSSLTVLKFQNQDIGEQAVSFTGSYGSLEISADGSYTYIVDLDNLDVLKLTTSNTFVSEDFSYVITDGQYESRAKLTITIYGSATAIEAGGTSNDVAGTDPTDSLGLAQGQTVLAVIPGVLSSEADVELAFVNSSLGTKGMYGNLTLTATGNYAYAIDNENITVQALRTLKNTRTDTFTYRLEDGSLGQFIVTIRGASDAPISTSDFADATESGGLSNATPGTNAIGNVIRNDRDVDAGDLLKVKSISFSGTEGVLGSSLKATYGSLVMNESGDYTYVVDDQNAAVQALRTYNDKLTETFTYKIKDIAGLVSNESSLTITIHGASDTPTAVVDESIAVASGSGIGTNATGDVLKNDTDIDANDTKTVSAVNGQISGVNKAITGTYGTLVLQSSGTYTYTPDNQNKDVQALAYKPTEAEIVWAQKVMDVAADINNEKPPKVDGRVVNTEMVSKAQLYLKHQNETLTESFTYTMKDTAGLTSTATLTVTIKGANNAAGFSGPTTRTATVVEDGETSAGGQIIVADVDHDETGILASEIKGKYGSFSVDASGNWGYTLDN